MSKSVRLSDERRRAPGATKNTRDDGQRRRDEAHQRGDAARFIASAADGALRCARRASSGASRGSRRLARRAPRAPRRAIGVAVHGALGVRCCISLDDALPLGTFGAARTRSSCSRNARACASAASAGVAPRAAPRRQVAGQLVEALLLAGRDRYSISCHAASLCRERWKSTRLEPPAIDAPGPVRARQRRVAQSSCALGRQAAPELAEVPRPGDVEREVAARELLLDVGDLRARSARGARPSRNSSR